MPNTNDYQVNCRKCGHSAEVPNMKHALWEKADHLRQNPTHFGMVDITYIGIGKEGGPTPSKEGGGDQGNR